jgi:hypothetical protein
MRFHVKVIWCERGDSNPHGFTRQILSLVRLPIPPLSQLQDQSLTASTDSALMSVADIVTAVGYFPTISSLDRRELHTGPTIGVQPFNRSHHGFKNRMRVTLRIGHRGLSDDYLWNSTRIPKLRALFLLEAAGLPE